jgi:hypothetical protein
MSKPVWIATEDGNLRHAKTDKILQVKSFELVKGKRGEMIEIEKPNGGKKTVIRFMVDETAFSFGPKSSGAQPASQPAVSHSRPASASLQQDAHAAGGRVVTLTREEALDLLHVARNLADALADKLIQETVAKAS